MVAARLGTVKVNEAKKLKDVHVVTPDWLWCCAERWERVNERLFPLTKTTRVTLKPPPHCISSEIPSQLPPLLPGGALGGGATLQRSMSTSSDTLPETMNPMLAFSSEELKGMDDEVAGSSSDSSTSSDEEETGEEKRLIGSAVLKGIRLYFLSSNTMAERYNYVFRTD